MVRYSFLNKCYVVTALTCHFKQLGLKEGLPRVAPSLVVKTYKACLVILRALRCGSSLAEYIRNGNLSNSRFIGCGVVGQCHRFPAEGLGEIGIVLPILLSSLLLEARCGIVQHHVCVSGWK